MIEGAIGPWARTAPLAGDLSYREFPSLAAWQTELVRYDTPPSQLQPDTPAGPPTTATVISVDTPMVLTDEGAIKNAYRVFAEQQGLPPELAQDYADRAYALTAGRVHAPSADPNKDGQVLSADQLHQQMAAGRLEISPTRAQLGLLYAMTAQQPDNAGLFTGQLGAPGVGPQFFPAAANVVPGEGQVSTEIAVKLLENIAAGRPPFRPELGTVGPVSWFVTEGNPHTGPGPANPVTIPVDISNPTGAPILEFNEPQLLEMFEREQRAAFDLVAGQYRAQNGIPADAPLSNTAIKRINRHASKVAERQMWTRVGEQVAASESGVGRVNLRGSVFSRGQDGQFTLTSRADAVKIRGGANALIEILRTKGEPAAPGVVEAAEKTAAHEKWPGRVQGVFKYGGRVLIIVGAAADGYRIYTADNRAKEAVKVAGGWAGAAAAGGAFATWAAPVNATGPWGWVAYGAGTLIAGGVGYFAGEHVAEEAYELVVDGDPIFVGPDD